MGDLGIGLWWSIVARILLQSRPDSPIVPIWVAIFQFLHALSTLLTKTFVKSDLDSVIKAFSDAMAYLESVIPSSLLTISMHSLVHLPDIIKRWGPLVGCVWTWPIERWVYFMKDVLQSTISGTIAIAQSLQMVQGATFLRSDFRLQYSLRNRKCFVVPRDDTRFSFRGTNPACRPAKLILLLINERGVACTVRLYVQSATAHPAADRAVRKQCAS